jgi:DNA-binding NarL/FixJ family response regulator
MAAVNPPLFAAPATKRLRVLVGGSAGVASGALTTWLRECAALEIAGPAASTTAALVLARAAKTEAVLLDFHGLPVSTAYTVAQLKEVSSPAPLVIVLTHDASPAMRRRCQQAKVDAVFDKTSELDALAALLEQTRHARR